jgi:hypothetical protein
MNNYINIPNTVFKIDITSIKEDCEFNIEYLEDLLLDIFQVIRSHKTPAKQKVINAMIYQEYSPKGVEPEFKIVYGKKSYTELYKIDLFFYGKRMIFGHSGNYKDLNVAFIDKHELKQVIINNWNKE